MKLPIRAAIYARISKDISGQALGVERQLIDARKYAADNGWIVAEEYVDNDASAYRGKKRPEYRRMLEDISAGQRDAVIVYKLDRLTRQPRELEEFADVMAQAKVKDFGVVSGEVRLASSEGIAMARLLGTFAALESDIKSDRLKRKAQEIAEAGRPNGGNLRPFGYEKNQLTMVESEAVAIRELASRYLAGESLGSLTAWLQDNGISSVAGLPWRTTALRQTLTNPRIAGLRAHNGVIVATAVWPAIITPAQHKQLVAAFARKAQSNRRAPRRYLLSGMLRCSKCGNKLYSSARRDTRRYVCMSGPDHGGGCGRLTIVAAPVEEWIAEAVLMRLDSPEIADALAGRAAVDERHSVLVEELQADQAQKLELSGMWARKEISSADWKEARDILDAKLYTIERQLSQITGTNTLDGIAGHGGELRTSWDSLNLTRQAAIVAAVLDFATISPGTGGGRREVDPNRIVPSWRL
ncbi:recombinase family protein [Lacisediminihabitans profunda]|uniref:Recombinase family protein n=1 Tax=Lacisediminihabitans profunda TaxID=2594790 RepID=A0A5C8UWG7_9MICO|nr:recombinase family protein [Lacisediminihabitans profunda]TXN31947.1 recombinase family protein [Lacisediminihabitans profunda]